MRNRGLRGCARQGTRRSYVRRRSKQRAGRPRNDLRPPLRLRSEYVAVVTPAAPASAIPVIAHHVLPAVNCARGSFDGIVVLGQHLETVFPDDLKQLQCGAARPLRAGFPLLHCRFPGVQVSRAAQVIVALPLAVILLPRERSLPAHSMSAPERGPLFTRMRPQQQPPHCVSPELAGLPQRRPNSYLPRLELSGTPV